MKVHNVEQRSEAWHALRRGRMTASKGQCIATNGVGLETYVYEILAEKYYNHKESYVSADMQRGIDLEDQARMTYEITNAPVEQVGFIELDEFVGCSPDGLLGEKGGIEIKCPNDTNFFKLLVKREKAISSAYLWQVQMCMLVSGRTTWDLVFYNPNFDDNMLVFPVAIESVMQEKLLIGLEKGRKLIRELTEKYERSRNL